MPPLHSCTPEIGAQCPEFLLPAVDGNAFSLSDFSKKKALLIAFICNHCPYVRAIEDRLIALSSAFSSDDFQLVGICSNDSENYPDDSPEILKKRWLAKSYNFPYLVDEDQTVAHQFGAVCTPDFFLYDQQRKLFYRGELDDNWKNSGDVKSEHMKDAIRALLAGEKPPEEQRPSMGCSIKWKK